MQNRPRLRRLAAYVLLVWLLGLASGIVNACILGDLRHGVPVAAGLHSADDGATAVDHHAGHGHAGHAGHDHQTGHGKPPCERLCDAPAARPADKELSSSLGGFWLAPAPLPSIALRLMPARSEPPPQSDQPWRATVPLSIAFARLTL